MNNKTNGLCCGGDYTVSADLVNPNAHQGSPSKRHAAAIERERIKNVVKANRRIKLAQYVAEYLLDNADSTRSVTDLIYSAIGKFEYEQD